MSSPEEAVYPDPLPQPTTVLELTHCIAPLQTLEMIARLCLHFFHSATISDKLTALS